MLPLLNEQFKQKYTNLCFNRYYETPSKYYFVSTKILRTLFVGFFLSATTMAVIIKMLKCLDG